MSDTARCAGDVGLNAVVLSAVCAQGDGVLSIALLSEPLNEVIWSLALCDSHAARDAEVITCPSNCNSWRR